MRLLHLNGPPGIGKSTLARRYVAEHPRVLNCDIDVLRTLVHVRPGEVPAGLSPRTRTGARPAHHQRAQPELAPARSGLLLLGIAIVVDAKRRWDLAESPTP